MEIEEVIQKIEMKVHELVEDLIQGRCKSKAYLNSQDLLYLLDELKKTLQTTNPQ